MTGEVYSSTCKIKRVVEKEPIEKRRMAPQIKALQYGGLTTQEVSELVKKYATEKEPKALQTVGLTTQEVSELVKKYATEKENRPARKKEKITVKKEKLTRKKIDTIDQSLVQKVYELHLNGYCKSEIQRELNIAEKTVQKILLRLKETVSIRLNKKMFATLCFEMGDKDIYWLSENYGHSLHDIIALFARAKRLNWNVPRETLDKINRRIDDSMYSLKIQEMHLQGYFRSEIARELQITAHRVDLILYKLPKRVTISLSKKSYQLLKFLLDNIGMENVCSNYNYTKENIDALFSKAKRENW